MKKLSKITLLFIFTIIGFHFSATGQWSSANLEEPTYRNGNVGIGVDSPQGKLHINSINSAPDAEIQDFDPMNPTPPNISYPQIRLNTFYEQSGQTNPNVIWDIDGNSSLNFSTIQSSNSTSTLAMSLYSDGGLTVHGKRLTVGDAWKTNLNIGIGASSYGVPAYHIGFGLFGGGAGGTDGTTFLFHGGSTGGAIIQGDDNGNLLFLNKRDDGDLKISSSENEDYTSMVINSNHDIILGGKQVIDHPSSGEDYRFFVHGGIVSNEAKVVNKMVIGTNNMPEYSDSEFDYKLVVNGGGIFKEVKVRSDFADYVFEEDYNLLSLKEVENHIKEKGHLHETPSAEHIQKNGLNVSEITTNQQAKIEELFLHLIEMEKRINDLEKENQELKSQVLKK